MKDTKAALQEIKQLVSHHKIWEAQKLYWKIEIDNRKKLIRL